ncbi:MAG: hypothetical protein KH846_09580 [Leptotrichia wadei]|uniref:hypothetical protein n=1 Tax=Leptotrichia wadei TaxID=157687 RepID=UPI0026EDB7C8|nr:hypothetical protein [Leptotrichia wadei]MBS6020421.1 hypothetical protein [Leptotrichia wadei]
MSDVLKEAKGASKWGDYDVYDLMSDKKLFYEDLTDFGWEEFYKFKKDFLKEHFPEKFKNKQEIVLLKEEFTEEMELELIREFTEKMIREEGKRFLEFAANYLEEKEKQEQKQKEVNEKHQKSLLCKMVQLIMFKKRRQK